MARYRVVFSYEETMFGFEEDYQVTHRKARYFNTFDGYQSFLQEIDMAGDETTKIIEESSVSDIYSDTMYLICKLLFFIHAYDLAAGRKLFYDLMRKTYRPMWSDKLCYDFDQKSYRKRKLPNVEYVGSVISL